MIKLLVTSSVLAIAFCLPASGASEYLGWTVGKPYHFADKGAPGGEAGQVAFATPGLPVVPPQALGKRIGDYWIEISWCADSTHGTEVAYAINDQAPTVIDQKQFSVENEGPPSGAWSGFRALGSFELKEESVLNVSSKSTVNFLAGSRLSKLGGILIEPSAIYRNGDIGKSPTDLSSPGEESYYIYIVGLEPGYYDLNSANLTPGTYKVEISWGIDGPAIGEVQVSTWTYDPGTAGGEVVTASVNNGQFSDGTEVTGEMSGENNNRQWSGFYDLGTVQWNPTSTLSFSSGKNLVGTGAVIQFTPVENTLK